MADQDLSNRVVELYQGVDELLNTLQIPDDERKDVEQSLMEAIAADLLVRLGNRLSDEQRAALAEQGKGAGTGDEPNVPALAEFFRGTFSETELVQALTEATESVLEDFAKEMENR